MAPLVFDGHELPMPPYGTQWMHYFSFTHTASNSVRIMRSMLDRMLADEFIWEPYAIDSPDIQNLPPECAPELWKAVCPLINYAIVEIHCPERVLRQFGMRQNIPPRPTECTSQLHSISRRGRPGTDWHAYHILYVSQWDNIEQLVVQQPTIIGSESMDIGYMAWYDQITRRLISPSSTHIDMGYRPDDASAWHDVAHIMQNLILSCDSVVDDSDITSFIQMRDQHRSIAKEVHRIATQQFPFNMPQQLPAPVQEMSRSRDTRRRRHNIRSSSSTEGDIA